MENTLENKAKFFALYWGQTVIQDVDNTGEKVVYPVERSNMYRFEESTLLLKPLSAISDEDIEYLTSIWSKGAQYPSSKDESINLLAYYASRDYATMAHDIVDYLRSKGYALPFLGLSVESQISYGWVKLAEVC